MVKLSLCVIVGGEEHEELETLLKSVQGPLFDEIVVTLTKEDEKVREVASRYADKTPFFKWINDFSAARNYCFKQASGDYKMWLDADDEVSPEAYQKLMEVKKELHNYDFVMMSYNYAQNEDGSPIVLLPRERIVANRPEFQWVDPIHEFIPTYTSHRKYNRLDIVIDHRRKRKYDGERNLSILRDLYNSGKASPRNVFYYAKDLFDNKGEEEAVPVLIEYLKENTDFYQNKVVACLKLAAYYKSKKEYESSKGYLNQALLYSQEYAEPYFEMGEFATEDKDDTKAVKLYEIALSKNPYDLFGAKVFYYKKGPLDRLVLAYDRLRQYDKALSYAEQYLAEWPNDKNSQYNVQYLKGMVGSTAKPVKAVRKTIDINSIRIGWFIDSIYPEDPSQRIRRLNVFEEMKSRGYNVSLHNNYLNIPDINWLADKISGSLDLAIFGGFQHKDLEVMRALKERGIKVVYDYNEAILDNDVVLEKLREADGVVCCSTRLQEMVKDICSRSIVIEDAFEGDEGEPYNYFLGKENDKLVALFIGMGGNSFLATEYLKDVIEEAGYTLEICTEWDNATHKWNLETWREVMKGSHVVLCPQRVDVQPAKSNIKAAQAMGMGIPVVASPLPAYREFIQHGVNGFLCNTKEEWKNALITLRDVCKRIQVGMNGKDAAQQFSIKEIVDKWAYAIPNVLVMDRVSAPSHEGENKKEVETAPLVLPPIPIVIPVYNGVDYLKACLTSIQMNTDYPYHLILSDAGSGKETWDYLNTLKGVTVLGKEGERLNFSEAVNEGVKASGGSKYFIVLNSDVLVSKGWVQGLVDKMEGVDRLAACGVLSNCDSGWLFNAPGKPSYSMEIFEANLTLRPGMVLNEIIPKLDSLNLYMEKSNQEKKGAFTPQPWVAYYATIFARSAWEEVGGLDTAFKNGCEDLDHCRRLTELGYQIGQAMDSFVFHFGGISRGAYQEMNREEYDKEDVYNHVLYKDKWSKKRVVIYTGPAWEKWNRATVDKGMAGSETWAAELGASFVKKGFEVTVFNDCPVSGEVDRYGVIYRDHSTMREWLSDKVVDHMILSRTCEPLKWFKLHSKRVDVMVHDIFLNQDRNYDTRQWEVSKFACLSDWHVDFFSQHHNIGKEKILLSANGVRPELYSNVNNAQKKNMAVYSSSPDRGLYQLLQMMPEIRKEVPDFELVIAYGFHNWKSAAKHRNNPEELKYIEAIEKLIETQPGVNYVGRVDKETLAQYQCESKIWLYPTWFSETFCITLVENGMAGNAAVTVPYAGILTVGGDAPVYIKGPEDMHPSKWSTSEGFAKKFVEATVRILKDDSLRLELANKLSRQVEKYTWDQVADSWMKEWGLL
jgi:GT2 family glycosyltransferase/tetratricopeptide (TPR) repeat protein